MKGDPLEKSEIILARHGGKMIFTVPGSMNRTGKELSHEPETMNTGDFPPRSAEILWKMAMERKKSKSAGNRLSDEVTENDINSNLINPQVPEYQISYPFSGLWQNGTTKTGPLLNPAKTSETPLLPIARQLFVLHGERRSPDASKNNSRTDPAVRDSTRKQAS
jgi:hypothetical protein